MTAHTGSAPIPETRTDEGTQGNRWTYVCTIILAVLILIPSMLGFIAKFIELYAVLEGDADGVFAVTPILNYLLASLGFFCLLVWAIGCGMFRDIERPKRTMLDREEALDRLN